MALLVYGNALEIKTRLFVKLFYFLLFLNPCSATQIKLMDVHFVGAKGIDGEQVADKISKCSNFLTSQI